ncbi:metal-sensitive transcriptional regulator [Rummeliibacillus suwonensis]|jgi:DNA-binding FrmR family transcriptional regulator|uniref:metal-sensitive transcriptional regulator n=1 Tax=Rummeliibacillus suwonensis TaxID=1306154 RepID=UPI0011B40691|nr:metal-sensitive transcriptional regulator [Rummeliibacillus suwonensis]MBO2536054.1 metal-sensitive transcriptional regulator [Rummeliibacillus suwonensis]
MEYNDQIRNRLKRLEGQLKGVIRMIDEGKDCKEVVTQLSASRSAIDRAIGLIVSTNLVYCMSDEQQLQDKNKEALIKEAVDLLVKSR